MKWEIFAKVNEFRTEMEVLIFKVEMETTFFRKRQSYSLTILQCKKVRIHVFEAK